MVLLRQLQQVTKRIQRHTGTESYTENYTQTRTNSEKPKPSFFQRNVAENEGPWSSQDRTLACGAEGPGFKSPRARQQSTGLVKTCFVYFMCANSMSPPRSLRTAFKLDFPSATSINIMLSTSATFLLGPSNSIGDDNA